FRDEPVDFVEWVPGDTVHANDYNPNHVAPPELRLLRRRVMADGYTQPIVTAPSEAGREIVDGAHRGRVGKEDRTIRGRLRGYLPVTTVRAGRTRRDRIAATIRHNRARGVHGVAPMADIVAHLVREGWTGS